MVADAGSTADVTNVAGLTKVEATSHNIAKSSSEGARLVKGGAVHLDGEVLKDEKAKLTQEAGGYVGTTDSEKLPNGKVKGTVTVRVPLLNGH